MSALEADGHSDRAKEHLVRVARRDGFPFLSPDFVPNTHMALALGEYARDRGKSVHRDTHAALFHAYFAQGRDIGRRDVLLEVAGHMDLPKAELERAWDERRYDGRLHEFLHLGLTLGLESTPATLVCNELIIGSRPYEVFRDAVERCLNSEAGIESRARETLT